MKSLRHRNGRGLLYDDAEANRAAYIDKTSSASGFAKLRDCRLINGSQAADSVQMFGGTIDTAYVHGKTIIAGSPTIKNSILDCSEVSGLACLDSVIATGITEICDSPTLKGGVSCPLHLHDAIIYGSPTVTGAIRVTGRVHEGTWTRPPKHTKLPWVDLSECIDGKLLLNCYCRPIVWWLRFGPKVAKKWDWSDDMVSVTLGTIRKEFT